MPDQQAPDPRLASDPPLAVDPQLDKAWHALHDNGDIQTHLPPVDPPAKTPEWLLATLRAIGHAIEWVFTPVRDVLEWLGSLMPDAPWAAILFWSFLALMAILLVWMVIDRVRHGRWRLPQWKFPGRARRRPQNAVTEDTALPDDGIPINPAWLAEADRLAGEGRYAEALHSLLLRYIEDMAAHRPQWVRPSLTARDLARAEGMPERARTLFADIAAVVEASLFGGRPAGWDEWVRSRAAYGDYARTWQRL